MAEKNSATGTDSATGGDSAAGTDSATGTAAAPASRITKLFDIRLIVGGLLTIYGVILLIKGLTDSSAAIAKGAGLRLNLWTGVGILIVGLGMLAWMKLAPLQPFEPEAESDTADGPRDSRA